MLAPSIPDSKIRGANMGPIWGRQDPGGPHVGPMNFVLWDAMGHYSLFYSSGYSRVALVTGGENRHVSLSFDVCYHQCKNCTRYYHENVHKNLRLSLTAPWRFHEIYSNGIKSNDAEKHFLSRGGWVWLNVLDAIKTDLPRSAAYLRRRTGSALVQVMYCRLFGAKPLSEPMLEYWQLDPWEQTSVKM